MTNAKDTRASLKSLLASIEQELDENPDDNTSQDNIEAYLTAQGYSPERMKLILAQFKATLNTQQSPEQADPE
jgi:hypothetical protein